MMSFCDRPFLFFSQFLLALALSMNPSSAGLKFHALARHKDIKYPKDFQHFDYVDATAPKGGQLKLGVIGTFDSTNPYLTKGTAPVGLSRFSEELVFESLMMRAPDEPFTVYAWVAESVEIAPDNSWIMFHLNPEAKWEDGSPITPEDVIFTHQVFKEKGAPNFRSLHRKIKKVERRGKRSVRFDFHPQEDGTYNSETPIIVAMMSVLPKAYFKNKDFEKSSLDFIPGSGPYKVSRIKPGHQIVYERRDNYWAKDLNIMRGKHNFDRVVVDYYRDVNVARMAFLAGEFDSLIESKFQEQERFKQAAQKPGSNLEVITYQHGRSVPFSTYCMNTRRPMFQDVRVRQALILAYDFHWVNENLFHGQYTRNRSFFENTELAHQGIPSAKERELLAPYKGDVPEEVFFKPFYPPGFNDTSSDNKAHRKRLKQAAALLKEAGYIVEKGQLVHGDTKAPFEFELMLYNKEDEKSALAYARDLKKLGITMKIRTLDPPQYEQRRLKFDYDMILQAWFAGNSPGVELSFYWSTKSATLEGSRNYPGVMSKAVDDLCDFIADSKTRSDLVEGCHALDRVLMWGQYVIPLYYNNRVFIVHKDHLGHPDLNPLMPNLMALWWSKPADNNAQMKIDK